MISVFHPNPIAQPPKAYSFRVNLNLTNTTYLAASTADQYKSKLRTVSVATKILFMGRYR